MKLQKTMLFIGVILNVACTPVRGMSKQQQIDRDVAHWVPYAFSTGPHLVTIKVPPGFRQLIGQPNLLPKREFDSRSEMYLLQKQYDYQSRGSFELAEFVIWAKFTKLAAPLPTTGLQKSQLMGALNALRPKPLPVDHNPQPSIEVVDGREWIYFEFDEDESYWTLLDGTTVFSVRGSYWENILKDAAWLRERKKLLRDIRDAVTIR